MARTLPEAVCKFCYAHNAWLVGGAARQGETPRDYDVVVPFAHWQAAAMLIPRDARPNPFGGWKFTSEGCEIDVWPADIGQLMTNAMVVDLYHPQTGARFQRQSEPAG